ncbi:U3 small nucleolar RNA-associated protein 6 homolog [Belonocnema kinseyi]|uniref:U3 small nucleolar RNA-associated protein 6 homolog n=1 Tax=Belonocnema kinseyi TaxID=2817044 RepID=UPI00143D1766|nr:U3 small nucleolar RNA-associated protein 6 homolog [Belonocnema kinseyi]
MAEFVEKRCEEMIPELEQMERIKLFDKIETRNILKKRKDYEYKLERHSKCREDFLKYIGHETTLLGLIKQRRYKSGITQKKSAIDYAIKNRVIRLYKKAIFRFTDDNQFLINYLKFCKEFGFKNCGSRMLNRILQIHREDKFWHIAVRWEIEEAKNFENARTLLLRGLYLHPTSTLLYLDMYKLELELVVSRIKTAGKNKKPTNLPADCGEISNQFIKVEIIYEEAVEKVNDVRIMIDLLNTTQRYENTEALQKKIMNDMINKYEKEPLVWDTMARRELKGLPSPYSNDTAVEVSCTEQKSVRDRIASCNEVYLRAVETLKSEEMWSLYIDCLLEINQKGKSLPNFKRKLLKTALFQGHQAKLLTEQYYLYWMGMLNTDGKDEVSQKKLAEVLRWATEALPNSEKLWHSRFSYHLRTDPDDSASEILVQATKLLGEKSLSVWRMKLRHVQAKNPEKTEQVFQSALYAPQNIAQEMKIAYLEWAVENKDIDEIRKIYKNMYLLPPFSLEFHKKMIEIEMMQPEIVLKKVRECFEIGILQLGSTDVKFWMDFVKFEFKHGDCIQAPKIYSRAVNALTPTLADQFIAEYSILKTNPEWMNISDKS